MSKRQKTTEDKVLDYFLDEVINLKEQLTTTIDSIHKHQNYIEQLEHENQNMKELLRKAYNELDTKIAYKFYKKSRQKIRHLQLSKHRRNV